MINIFARVGCWWRGNHWWYLPQENPTKRVCVMCWKEAPAPKRKIPDSALFTDPEQLETVKRRVRQDIKKHFEKGLQ